jgi:uncharacterized protein (TIGR03435 family)
LGRPLLDKTGMLGTVDFILEWMPERRESAQPATDDVSSGPNFQEAMREQLGLKLESEKGPLDVIVVDHVEDPSGN